VGGTEYIIGFESSQALPVCPSGKAVFALVAVFAEEHLNEVSNYRY
jgi:hypothetical protein